METKIDEIAPDIYRLSTWIADVAPPAGFTFNQFVIRGEEPLLFHTGMRQLFPLVSAAVDRVVGVKNLRWISFAHVEADELGAMNQFLAAAPAAQVVHGPLAVMVSLNDLADRPRGRSATSSSTSETSSCASSQHPTSRTTGRADSGSRRPPGPCWPATSSRR